MEMYHVQISIVFEPELTPTSWDDLDVSWFLLKGRNSNESEKGEREVQLSI